MSVLAFDVEEKPKLADLVSISHYNKDGRDPGRIQINTSPPVFIEK